MDIPPNQTIYINNINEKVKKEELKRSLYGLFTQFGPVLDIVAMKTPKMRGQAFICFRDLTSATNALRAMHSQPLYGKYMRIHYSRSKSNCLTKMDGSFYAKDRKRKAMEAAKNKTAKKIQPSKPVESVPVQAPRHYLGMDAPRKSADEPVVKKTIDTLPNTILFISNLPDDTTEQALTILLEEFPGFREARNVPGRADIAFAEFETKEQAETAKDTLQGFKMTPTKPMNIAFARR